MKAVKGLFIVLVLISPAFAQDVAQCRTDLKTWMPMTEKEYTAKTEPHDAGNYFCLSVAQSSSHALVIGCCLISSFESWS